MGTPEIFSLLAAIATSLVLPILSYLIVRRDQKIDIAELSLHKVELTQVRLEGEVKTLQVFSAMVRDNITRSEFETAMASVNRGLSDIKERLDWEREK